MPIVDELLPLLRQFCRGEYGIALGGAHAKGVEDEESDLDLYVFAREVIPAEERERLCRQFVDGVESIYSWGDETEFVQAGTDFYIKGLKVECWLRHIDYISNIVDECKDGIVKQDLVTWTVMGFYNHCTLSDLHKMKLLDDLDGILAGWKSELVEYPPKMRETIIADHLAAAKFWPRSISRLVLRVSMNADARAIIRITMPISTSIRL